MIKVELVEDTALVMINQVKGRLGDLSIPLLKAAIATRDAAVWRIKTGGGDQKWVPNKAGTHTGIDTGTMWQSIGVAQAGPTEFIVTANVRYAKWFQQGTGIFAGHTAWTITPKTAMALSWIGPGGERFFSKSVVMPGQPARPFLYFDAALSARITRIFQAHLMLGESAA